MADPFPEGPTPGPSIVLFSMAPTIEPTIESTFAPIATAIQQQQNSNILPWLNFCVYVIFTFLILGLMVYINRYVEAFIVQTDDELLCKVNLLSYLL